MNFTHKHFTPPHLIFTLLLALTFFTGCQVESDDSNTEPTKKTFAITFDANGGSGEMKAQTAESGSEITLAANAFTREDWTFSGWATSAGGNIVHKDGGKIKLTENLTLYAQWTEIGKVEKVTFSATGDVDYNDRITLSCGTDGAAIYYLLVTGTDAPTDEEFSSSKKEYSGPITITENSVVAAAAVKDGMKDSETATATFTVKTYTVTFETAHGTVPTKIEGLKKGDTLGDKLQELTAEGYKFDGWFNRETKFTAEMEITSDITLTAEWTAISYKIIYKNAENASNSNPETYTIETAITLAAPTKGGSDFIGWYSEASFENEVTKIAKGTTGDITLYAKFITNSLLFYSQKWNYADDDFGVALPAKLELKRSIAAGDTLGAPFTENAVAFCTAGVWGEDDTVIYYVDGDYALWSYAADGTKTQMKEAVAGATGAFVSYDNEGKCLFALYGFGDTADQKVFVKDTVSGKSFTILIDVDIQSIADITAVAGSKKDSYIFIASNKGYEMGMYAHKFSRGFSAMFEEGSEVSSSEESESSSFHLGGKTPFNTEPLKKDPIQYKITDMTVIGGKLYALFASCFESNSGGYASDTCVTYGNYSSGGGVLRINYSGNLSVDTTFGTDGVAGYSNKLNIRRTVVAIGWLIFEGEKDNPSLWSKKDINSNLEFNNPQKIVAIKPDELVIAENGIAWTSDDMYNFYNLARAVTMDLNGKIKSVTAVHGKSFSYGGFDREPSYEDEPNCNVDGLAVASNWSVCFE